MSWASSLSAKERTRPCESADPKSVPPNPIRSRKRPTSLVAVTRGCSSSVNSPFTSSNSMILRAMKS